MLLEAAQAHRSDQRARRARAAAHAACPAFPARTQHYRSTLRQGNRFRFCQTMTESAPSRPRLAVRAGFLDAHAAGGRRLQPGDDLDQRALAAAARPENAGKATRAETMREAVERDDAVRRQNLASRSSTTTSMPCLRSSRLAACARPLTGIDGDAAECRPVHPTAWPRRCGSAAGTTQPIRCASAITPRHRQAGELSRRGRRSRRRPDTARASLPLPAQMKVESGRCSTPT